MIKLYFVKVVPYINIHTHECADSAEVMAIVNCDYNAELVQNCSIGIHPWATINIPLEPTPIEDSMSKIRELSKSDKVIAIGETGIDSLRGANVDIQLELLRQHALISEETKKPLIIHCVKAYSEIMNLKKEMHPTQRWIIHGYRKKQEQAQDLIKKGFDLSFGHYFDESSLKLAYEQNRLWLETDTSHITIQEQYENVAKVLEISVDELRKYIYERAILLSSAFRQE